MKSRQVFTIDKVAWHTRVVDNPETPEMVRKRFMSIVSFLQTNNLTKRILLKPGEEPSNEFAISTEDLTDQGIEVMKKGYDKWLKRTVNKRKDVSDMTILVDVLATLKSKQSS